MSFRW